MEWESRTRLIASWPAPPNCSIVPLSAPDYCYPYRYYLIPAKFGFSAWRAAPHCSGQRRPAQQFHKREKSMSSRARQSPTFPGSGAHSAPAVMWTDRRIAWLQATLNPSGGAGVTQYSARPGQPWPHRNKQLTRPDKRKMIVGTCKAGPSV